MSIQGLLQKGRNDCSLLEKTADVLLAFPRLLWLDRYITVKTGGSTPSFDVGSDRDQYRAWGAIGPNLVALVAYILATPFLVVGLACKKIALLSDSKANVYHNIIELSPEDTELLRKKEALEKQRDDMRKLIDENDTRLKDLVAPQNSKEVIINLIKNERTSLESANQRLEIDILEYTQKIIDIENKWKPVHQKVEEEFNKFKSKM
ncbi:MAG: hypothetical protein ACH350_10485 [Parachlamydiaceae bacterium]